MIIEKIKKQNIQAMRDKDKTAKTIYSVLLNKYKLLEIEKRTSSEELSDVDMIKLIQKTVKELLDEKSNFEKVNNSESVKDVEKQISLIEVYLPKMLTEEEIKNIINSLEDKSIPNVMKHFKTNYNGQCDMGLVNKTLRSL